jgi:hypothetical protein
VGEGGKRQQGGDQSNAKLVHLLTPVVIGPVSNNAEQASQFLGANTVNNRTEIAI